MDANKKKILVINPDRIKLNYQVGGEVRTLALSIELTGEYDVDIISVATKATDNNKIQIINDNLRQRLVYEGPVCNGIRVLLSLFKMPPNLVHIIHTSALFKQSIFKNIDKADVIIFEFPYLFSMLDKDRVRGKVTVYDAHNVEYDLLLGILRSHNIHNNDVFKLIYAAEKRACDISDIVLALSSEDKHRFIELYGVPEEKIFIIPCGVKVKDLGIPTLEKKKAAKEEIGVRKAAIFIGSIHPPNIDAFKILYNLAVKLPKYDFIIVGSMSLRYC